MSNVVSITNGSPLHKTINNEVIDQVLSDCNGVEQSVLKFIARNTVGYNKLEVRLTYDDMQRGYGGHIGINKHDRSLRRAVKSLVLQGFLYATQEGGVMSPNTYTIRMDNMYYILERAKQLKKEKSVALKTAKDGKKSQQIKEKQAQQRAKSEQFYLDSENMEATIPAEPVTVSEWEEQPEKTVEEPDFLKKAKAQNKDNREKAKKKLKMAEKVSYFEMVWQEGCKEQPDYDTAVGFATWTMISKRNLKHKLKHSGMTFEDFGAFVKCTARNWNMLISYDMDSSKNFSPPDAPSIRFFISFFGDFLSAYRKFKNQTDMGYGHTDAAKLKAFMRTGMTIEGANLALATEKANKLDLEEKRNLLKQADIRVDRAQTDKSQIIKKVMTAENLPKIKQHLIAEAHADVDLRTKIQKERDKMDGK